jgi:putative DNA primase/helicase
MGASFRMEVTCVENAMKSGKPSKKHSTANKLTQKMSSESGKRPLEDDPETGLVLTRAADVEAERLRWIWPTRISRGNVTIIFDEPGVGKSQIAAKLAATVSTGGNWPCEEGSAPKGNVIVVIAEDGSADTVRPRLEAAGADLKRVHIIREIAKPGTDPRPFSLLADLDALDEALQTVRTPRLVIFDPLSAFVTPTDGEPFNVNDVIQVRGLLSRVDALAKKHDTGMVFIGHPTKASGSSALYRLAGSSALTAAARAAFVVTRGQADSKWRVFAPAKNNLGADSRALQFRIRTGEVSKGIRAPYIVWNKNP